MKRILYDILFFFFSLIYLPTFLLKGKHKKGFVSRFGALPKEIKEGLKDKQVLWIHGVSVGEMAQALKLAKLLRDKLKNAAFLFTTTTGQGLEFALKHKDTRDFVTFFPVDFRWSVRSFLKKASPKALLIIETEIWPNLIWECSGRHIPVFIVNARLSDKAMPKYLKIKRWIAPILNRLSGILAQDELMKSRFLELGAQPSLVTVTGNMKFDSIPTKKEGIVDQAHQILRQSSIFLCIAGSTHEGEEAILFDVYKSLKKQYPFFCLMIAPRHVNRLGAIREGAHKKAISLKMLSQILNGSEAHEKTSAHNGVILVDQVGILTDLYRLADIVVMGGSFVPKIGGHNIAEPALCEKPILFGPFMNNFKEIVDEFKKANAVVQVSGAAMLEEEIVLLLNDKERRNLLGTQARAVVSKHEGATQKNAEWLFAKGGLSRW